MLNIDIHSNIVEKLRTKHKVTIDEVHECFSNVTKGFLIDTREDNQTDPITRWFIEETDQGRELLVAFMHFSDTNKIVIKSAYEPNYNQKRVYNQLTSNNGG